MRRSSRATERDLSLDWIRVLVILAVVAVHVCEVFNPWDDWHVSSPQRNRFAGELVVFFAPWIMPLLMLVAGTSTWYALERRSIRRFVADRFTRVLVPLVAGTLLLSPPQVWMERRFRGQFSGSLLDFYPHFFDGIYPRGNFSWHHLWFLAHLFLYSLIALPLIRYWRTPRGRERLHRLALWCGGPFGLLWLAAPLVLERHLLWWLLPARGALTADWANHAILAVAYVYGYMIAAEPALARLVDEQWQHAALVAGLMAAALWAAAWRGFLPGGLPEPYSAGYLAIWSLYGAGAWAWMVAALGASRRWLRRDTAFLEFSRPRSYVWYLVHQPVVIAAAVLVIPSRVPAWSRFPAIALIAAAGTLGSAELIRRSTIGRRLF
ncbi:MAG: acyltransferase family protein, partial [Gemmatimonadaceae bacterium]|nr:acyltransferase family protein [Gemmatimonadaceae bacterium]